MKKYVNIFLIIIIIFFMTSCETHKEISELGMVTAMGIEKKDNEYFISVQVANIKKSTNMGVNNASKVTLYTSSGKTCFEAIRKISNISSKKLYFPHIKLIILSDEIINEDPYQIIDFFARDNEGNINSYVLISTNNTPYDILTTITSFEDVPAEYISNSMLMSTSNYGNTHILRFEDYVKSLISNKSDSYFTKISLTNENKDKNNTEELNSINLSTYIKLGNILVFNKENKLVELSDKESIVLNILNKESDNSIITLKCDNNKYTTLELMNNSSNIKYIDNNIVINLNVTYNISDYNCNKNLLDNNVIESLKKDISNELIKNTNSLINKSIEYESDFMSFKKLINKDLNKLNFKINTNIDLQKRGDLINIIKRSNNE